ncbi:MAG: putative transcriptional regulatory protein pdtaR [bacterium ADurb.Bin243]|nr:MAG: putative transcriptional regulatory protein pdtaR [bacterium ADurb.Bin243]
MDGEKNKTLLLVEDDSVVSMVESMQLNAEGYTVIQSRCGEDAIAIMASGKEPIDLILMDIDLGSGIDGTEAAREILKKRDIPVVFLSSHTEKEIVEKTEKITSYGYVVKNSAITVLDASIKMAFKLFEAKTKEKEKNAALRKSEARFRNIVEAADEFIFEVDSRGVITFISDRIRDILGYDPGQMAGKTIFDFTESSETGDRMKLLFAEGLRRRRSFRNIEQKCLARDGSRKVLLASAIPFFNENGETEGYQGAVRDITESKRGSESLQLQSAALDQTEDLVTTTGLVRSLMLLYDRLYQNPNENGVSVREYLTTLIGKIAGIFPHKAGVRIETRIEDATLNAKILSPLGLIINELMTNSMKHAFGDGSKGEITVTVSKKEKRMSVTFEDDGPGLPESVTIEKSPGYGFQLVHMLVKRINGVMTVENHNGTRFLIEFEP